MIWSLDFDISAFAVCLLFVIYYILGKNLPIRRNYLFMGLLLMQLTCTFTDIISSVISSYPERFSYQLIYFVNIIYYIALAFCPLVFTLFCYYVAFEDKVNIPIFWILHIPLAFVLFIIITTPLNHFIFSVEKNGVFKYEHGRPIIYYLTLFYMMVSLLIIIFKAGKTIRRGHCYVLIFYIAATLMGHSLQVFIMPYKQTVSLGVVIGLTTIFLAFQNPDYYREKRTGLFNVSGLELFANEEYFYGKNKPFLGFIITNYTFFKFADNEYFVTHILRQGAHFLNVIFKNDLIFYYGNGIFIIFMDDKKDLYNNLEDIKVQHTKTFTFENASINFDMRFFYNDGNIAFKDYIDLRDTLNVAIENCSKLDNQKILEITEETHKEAIHRAEIEKALKLALEKEENILIYYQPIYSTVEKKINSAEALVRLYDPEKDCIFYPDDFIHIAEKNGCILKLGMLIFKNTCKMIKEKNIQQFGIKNIEINLSPHQCMNNDLSKELISIMSFYSIDPSMITLEITETASLEQSNVYKNIDELIAYGVQFALDDYGTGYSNLVHILKIPFSIIKIDKSISWDYFRSGNKLLTEVIDQFLNRNKIIVAEGVEDKEMAVKLAELGVQLEQGYYYSKPIPLDNFIDLVNNYNEKL
ncbi:MAG: EAL domain-containing protein [Butyrivibrio sp.]|nr:EAL domain-containing protein [Butyrivibrio sp.]